MKKIKKGDVVQVISGKQKGDTGTILKSLGDYVVVSGINIKKRATKGKGFIEKNHAIHISNVAYYDVESKQKSKINIVTNSDGKRVRKIVSTGRIA